MSDVTPQGGRIDTLDEAGVARLAEHLKLKNITSTLVGGSTGWTQVGPSYNEDTELREFSLLPYAMRMGAAVVLGDEIHILGGEDHPTYHDKWDGTNWWNDVSTLPCNFANCPALVMDNEIYIADIHDELCLYKWDGTSWSKVTPEITGYHPSGSSGVVLGNEIHIIGGDDDEGSHYKWDGTSWSEVSTLPYTFVQGSAVVYNNEIHILGGQNGKNQHFKWDGTSWTYVSTLPCDFYRGAAVTYNGEIHIFAGFFNPTSISTKHYKWNGTSWSEVATYTDILVLLSSAVVYNGEIHILGASHKGSDNGAVHCELYKSTFVPAVYTQTATVTGLKATDIAIVSQGQMSATDREEALKSQITPTVQAANALTFEAKTPPTVDVPIVVTIQGGTLS